MQKRTTPFANNKNQLNEVQMRWMKIGTQVKDVTNDIGGKMKGCMTLKFKESGGSFASKLQLKENWLELIHFGGWVGLARLLHLRS